jgi:RHS repeat-associated protein
LADEQVATGSPNDVRWPLADWQGTIRDVATYNAATNVTTIANHKVYEAFGKVHSESGPTVDTIFGFTGRYFDDDTGLQWNLNRWYDPGVGRWLSEDPIGFAAGDPNLYRYVGNSVGAYVDPEGLETVVMVHATTPEAASNIVTNGLQPGIDRLRWLSSPDAAGSGASVQATVRMQYKMDCASVTDIPKSVERDAIRAAYRSLKDSPLTGGARSKAFGRAIGDYIAEWVHSQPDGVYRRLNPNGKGYQYAIKGNAWQSSHPVLTKLSGRGSTGVLQRLGRLDDVASAAARTKWGARVRFAGKVGGRVLVVVGIGNSAYEIYAAENKAKEITRQVGGWTGACTGAKLGSLGGARLGAGIALAAGQFGPQVAAPEEAVTVPLGAGAGAILGGFGGALTGWWVGTEVTETVYEWTFEEGF